MRRACPPSSPTHPLFWYLQRVTLATRITLCRILLVPVFVILAWHYGHSLAAGCPVEWTRWAAFGTFVVAAASDGLDGWLARRRHECTRLGAILDPIADKSLLISSMVTLSLVAWRSEDWRIPLWFLAIVLLRDGLILLLISVLKHRNGRVAIRSHWSGKLCVAGQMVVVAWTMLPEIPSPPLIPCLITTLFAFWSGGAYLHAFSHQLRHPPDPADDPVAARVPSPTTTDPSP